MAYHISDDCISCGACEAECPVGAISEGDGKFEINADLCAECGSCADACPVGGSSPAVINLYIRKACTVHAVQAFYYADKKSSV